MTVMFDKAKRNRLRDLGVSQTSREAGFQVVSKQMSSSVPAIIEKSNYRDVWTIRIRRSHSKISESLRIVIGSQSEAAAIAKEINEAWNKPSEEKDSAT